MAAALWSVYVLLFGGDEALLVIGVQEGGLTGGWGTVAWIASGLLLFYTLAASAASFWTSSGWKLFDD